MRNPCALVLCLFALACGGPLTDAESGSDDVTAFEPETVLPGTGDLRSAFDFEISSGHHRSNHDFIAKPHLGSHVDRSLQFSATFAANAVYTTQSAGNQSDWNKLMGITTDRIHKNSIRIGWAWNPRSQRIDLGYYGYMDGVRVMQRLTDVAPGDRADCSLQMTNNSMTATANGVSHTETGGLGVSLPLTWILHSVYFGGDETAPHDIAIDVTGINAD